ncbi:MAG: hypothetical protein ISS28_05950 [Candidatus Cloacimonetes bacterium]|nr:hypothetical protein [Candidatus Cloacimonadota bacterium]
MDGIVCLQDANVEIGNIFQVEIIDSLYYDMVAKLTKKEK